MITPELLTSLGIDFHQKGIEFILNCPYCGKAAHLYLNQSGAFKCHHCQESGGWAALRKEYGGTTSGGIQEPRKKAVSLPSEAYVDACHKRLLGPNGTPIVEHLNSRKITLEQIHKFKLGMDKKENNFVLVIPIFENGKPVNVKYRTIPPTEKQFFRWPNGKSALLNGDILKNLKADDPIFIAEGEIDAISLSGFGYNVVGVTAGAGTISPSWIKQLERVKKIYLVYDNDEPGQKGSKEIARRLGIERCFNIVLDQKDANQWLTKGAQKRRSAHWCRMRSALRLITFVRPRQPSLILSESMTKNRMQNTFPLIGRL
jgi:5S rRNA maturation endonuclease (ribonuclease M5)